MSFSTLGLSPAVCAALQGLGYAQPTPVQTESIPLLLKGRDLLARAQTGTGKTAAFGLPMIDQLLVRASRPLIARKPHGLILVPTRELALQVHQALTTYGARVNLRAVAILGGMPMRPQTQALQRGAHIVIATPGRLLDHLDQRTIDLSSIAVLVLDEADRMLDMGFLPALRRIQQVLPRTRQTSLFSATFPQDVIRLSTDFTHDPARVDVAAAQSIPTTVTHRVHPVHDGRKADALAHVVKQPPVGQALVFCRTKRGSNRVGDQLARSGVKTAVIHGNKSQNARNRALDDFKAGRVMVLVATDIAARGLDIAQLPLVVNYDLPLVAEDYIHRVGRTGRAGVAGHAVSLVSAAERGLLHDIQRLLPVPIEHVPLDGFDATAPHHHPVRSASPGNARHFRPGAARNRSRKNRHGARGISRSGDRVIGRSGTR